MIEHEKSRPTRRGSGEAPEPAADPIEVTPEDLAVMAQLELQWAEFFRVIIAERDPIQPDDGEPRKARRGTGRVRKAEEAAVLACYRAVERFAVRFSPEGSV